MTTFTGHSRRISPRAARREGTDAVRAFVLGGERLPDAWVPASRLLAPTVTYLRVGAAFERHGLAHARTLIGPVADRGPGRRRADRATAYCARSAAWRILGLARTVAGRHLCLHESLGLCAALRTLGFGVQVVIAYPVIELASGEEELHAWPALGLRPLTGRTDGEPLSYAELERFPGGGAPC